MAFATLPGTLIHIDKALEAIAQGNVADPSLQIARVEFADGTEWSRMLSSLWGENKQGCRIGIIHSANLVPVDCR